MSMNNREPGIRQETHCGPTKTRQSQGPATNINNIIAKYKKTGELTHISTALMQFRDVSGLPSLHEAMNVVADANSTFMELPAEVRKACKHDVSNFIPYLEDPGNREEAESFGLLDPTPAKPVPTPPEAPVETPTVPVDP